MSGAPPLIPQPGEPRPVLLGFSGGLDSTVLLHLLAATPSLHGGLRAIHVHHGMQAPADAWQAHCEAACAVLCVPLESVRVQVPPTSGPGPEAAARSARHAAFAASMREGEVLALAHHADDQAETFLLRALRASGPDGLAAMQPWRRHGDGWLWRPLLGTPRDALLAWAREHRLDWIEDPSNADTALDRNYLRRKVMPLLRERWPNAGAALSRSAALSGQAAGLLEGEDARALQSVRGASPDVLDSNALKVLPEARRARVLRLWIRSLGLPPLPASGIERVESDLLHAAPDADAAFAWSGACLRRWRRWLHAGRQQRPWPDDWRRDWDGRRPLELPGGGWLRLEGPGTGFDAPVVVHGRRGGERLTLPGRTHSHALKHVLQDAGVPPWERGQLPLLSAPDGTLLAAGDRIASAGFTAWLEARGARLSWMRALQEPASR